MKYKRNMEIWKKHAKGRSYSSLAREYKLSVSRITDIIKSMNNNYMKCLQLAPIVRSVRNVNILNKNGIYYVDDIVRAGGVYILSIKNIGVKTVNVIANRLKEHEYIQDIDKWINQNHG